MEVIRGLIQTIVVIVVLAVFIEMLLPSGDMSRYVKMVMGLLIIVAVLHTVTGVMNSDLMQELPRVADVSTGAPPLEDIMVSGKQLTELTHAEAVKKYSEALEGQVLSVARLNPGVNAVDARVSVEGENKKIYEISIFFRTGEKKQDHVPVDSGQVIDIQPVVVGINGNDENHKGENRVVPTSEEDQAALEVSKVVAEFYNLKPQQVKYEFTE